jgi:tetratricopeptide (TPR) repeat protein
MRVVSLLLILCVIALANGPLVGEIIPSPGNGENTIRAQLSSQINPGPPETVLVGLDGRFRFDSPAPGQYLLRIINGENIELFSQMLNVTDTPAFVTIRLAQARSEPPTPGASPISVTQLRHKANKKAVRAAETAQQLTAKGDHPGAIAALRQAVTLDPGFADAHGNLGAEFALVGNYQEAAAELHRAALLAPSSSWIHSNLAYVLYQSGEPAQAEREARRAVALDSRNPQARYLLGVILAGRQH